MVSCSQLSVIPGGQQRNKPRLILRCARGQPKHITVCNQTIFLLHSGVGNISIQGQQSARPLFNFCVAIGKRYATGTAMLITRQLDEFCGRVGGGVEQSIIHTIRMFIYKYPAITGTGRVKVSRFLGKIPLRPAERFARLQIFIPIPHCSVHSHAARTVIPTGTTLGGTDKISCRTRKCLRRLAQITSQQCILVAN